MNTPAIQPPCNPAKDKRADPSQHDFGGRPALETLVEDITGVKPLRLQHDISTPTGEEIVIFTLAETPCFREAKTR